MKIKETTLRDYLRIIFRYKVVFIVLPLAILIPVYTSLLLQTPMNVAKIKMNVKGREQVDSKLYEMVWRGNPVEPHLHFLKSNIVLERVVEALKLYQIPLDHEKNFASRLKAVLIKYRFKQTEQRIREMTPEERKTFLFRSAVGRLRGNVSATQIELSSFFSIEARDFNPKRAVLIANSLSRSYLIFDLEQQIAELKLEYGEKYSTIRRLENYIEELQKTLDGRPIPDSEARGPATVKIINQAKSALPIGVLNKPMLLGLSFVASLFLSVIFCFLFHYFDQTFRSSQDIEEFLDIRFLGSIPKRKFKDKPLISSFNPHSTQYTLSYENLSDQIFLLLKNKKIKSLLITDAEGSQDNAAVIANIATSLAQKAKQKVLIIDANLRRASISRLFGIADNQGLNEMFEEKMPFEEAVHVLDSNLHILPSGATVTNPLSLLDSSRMSDIIDMAKERYEIILISCAGFRNFSDAAVLSSITDGVTLVIREGKVRRQVIQESVARLKQKKVNMIGAVLTDHKHVIPKIIYRLV